MSAYPKRRPAKEVHIDLDAMGPEELRAFIDSWPHGMSRTKWATQIYPDKPIYFTHAAYGLWYMAKLKLEGRPGFESRYKALPKFAQWRRRYNVLACVKPGERFRKTPPKKTPQIVSLKRVAENS